MRNNKIIIFFLCTISISCILDNQDDSIINLSGVTTAHTGYFYNWNSKDAIIAAIDKGFKVIEVDLFLSSDRKVIIAHPPISSFYETNIDYLDYFSFINVEFRNNELLKYKNPPLLEDLLYFSKENNLFFELDVKFNLCDLNEHELRMFIEKLYEEKFLIYASCGDYSFIENKKEYDYMRRICPDLIIGFVCISDDDFLRAMGYIDKNNSVIVSNGDVAVSSLIKAEQDGYVVEIYVENDEEKILEYFSYGVDRVLSDDVMLSF